jgi:hypothetical protein
MIDKPDDDLEALAAREVGYASPPFQYRWPKGFCPNPMGRPPRKAPVMDISPLNDFDRKLLKDALKVVATIDGRSYTSLEKTLLILRTSDRPEDRKVLLRLYQEALEKDHRWREQAVLKLMEYKEHWGPTFKARRQLGKALPSVVPDPDDILIHSSTEFRFIGPVTAEEAEYWKLCKGFRSACVSFAEEIIERAGLFAPVDDDRQAYEKLRRKYYRHNRHVPHALKQKYPMRFPAFKPPSEPPSWYSESDEWRDPETGEWVVSDPLPKGT